MSNTVKFHGCPGTGKTRRSLEEVKKAIIASVPVEQIMYNTYRRFAADDAIDQIKALTKAPKNKMKNINTTHGICYRLLKEYGYVKSSKNDIPIMTNQDYEQFNEDMGYHIRPGKTVTLTDRLVVHKDEFLTFNTVMSSTGFSAVQTCNLPFFHDLHLLQKQALQFTKDFKFWKQENNKIDFNDMPELVLKYKLFPNCKIQIYDEFQDSTTLLHDVAQMWSTEADQVFLAGDPLQTIYTHLGATPEYFNAWPGTTEILKISYRLPASIWKIASEIISWNTQYTVPDEVQTKEANGVVGKLAVEQLPAWLRQHPQIGNVTIFHLVRTNEIGYKIAKILASAGVPFSGIPVLSWSPQDMDLYNAVKTVRTDGILSSPEVQFLQQMYPDEPFIPSSAKLSPQLTALLCSPQPFRSRKIKGFTLEKLQGAINADIPRLNYNNISNVQILTIHGSKGLEADIVYLHNMTSPKISNSMQSPLGRSNEALVWYVAVTRARHTLYAVNHTSRNVYPLVGEWK
jgi:superfamily I DNA/RNA helicase